MLAVSAIVQRGDFRLNVHLELPTPGVVALFGRSGCGKSTLINVIAGLLAPQAGHVTLDGTVWLDTTQRVALAPERRHAGYVFQDARLFPHLRVAANLRYGLTRSHSAVYVSFDDVVSLLDLAPLLTRRTHQLSGGERQRVAIGRALLSQPRLLLLDEPLAALDSARREEVMPYLETLRDALAVPMVYVTHDFDEVLRLSTCVVLMEAGSVIAQGGVGEISLNPGLRAIIGPDQVGAILDGVVLAVDDNGLTRVRIGNGELKVQASPAQAPGTTLRVQMLARDIIISTAAPRQLSVRNSLAGSVVRIDDDDAGSDLIVVDVGNARILSRITKGATRELDLKIGSRVWTLVKAASLRGRAFNAPISGASPNA